MIAAHLPAQSAVLTPYHRTPFMPPHAFPLPVMFILVRATQGAG